MRHAFRYGELSLATLGALLLYWSARDRVAFPAVRPIRDLRWWFPWPKAGEFRTHSGYRTEQLGRLVLWAFSLLVVVELTLAVIGVGPR